MVHEGWKTHSFLVDDELIKKLTPRMAFSNFDWHEIKTIQDISGNEKQFVNRMKTYIRNLKKDSIALDAAVGHILAAKSLSTKVVPDDSSQQQKQGSQDRTPGNLSENLDQQEQIHMNDSILKKVKITTSEDEKAANSGSTNLEILRKRNLSAK